MEGELHNRFSDEELRKVFSRYENGLVDVSYMLALLNIKRRRFFLRVESGDHSPEAPTEPDEPN